MLWGPRKRCLQPVGFLHEIDQSYEEVAGIMRRQPGWTEEWAKQYRLSGIDQPKVFVFLLENSDQSPRVSKALLPGFFVAPSFRLSPLV